MLFDGAFISLSEIQLSKSDTVDEKILHSCEEHFMKRRLSRFVSADFCNYSIEIVSYTHLDVYKRQGLNCSSRIFCNSVLKSESFVVMVHRLLHWARIPIWRIYVPTVLSEMTSPVFRSSTVIFGAP